MSDKLTKEEERQFIHIKDKFFPLERIDEGTFSIVFKAKDLRDGPNYGKLVAIKNITRTTSPVRIEQELKFLKQLAGKYNTIKLLYCERYEDQVLAVFPHIEFTDFRVFLEISSMNDIKFYMYNLLVAMKYIHSFKIMHRDLKPSNFLYNIKTKKGVIIDFGLAEYEKNFVEKVEPEKKGGVLFYRNSITRNIQPPGYYVADQRPQMKASRSGTRGFRAPEVLFKSPNQTTKIDMWCCGIIFLILLTRRYPFFYSIDDIDSLVEIACIFGSHEMKKAAKYYDRVWKSNIETVPIQRVHFETLVKSLNPKFADSVPVEAYDLLYSLLDLYSDKRISASAALEHPFLLM